MTTIAYRDGIMAADQIVTDRGCRFASTTKVHKLCDGSLLGVAGDLGCMQAFSDWALAGFDPAARPDLGDDSFEALVVSPDGAVRWYGSTRISTLITGPYAAIGSGFQLAIGALWMGASAAKAVACAIELDTRTGGAIDTISLDGIPACTVL